RFFEKHYSHDVLQADVRNFTIVDDGSFICCKPHGQSPHFGGVKRMLLPQNNQGIERRLNRGTHGPFLDVGARHFVALAQFVDEPGRIGVGIVCREEIIFSSQVKIISAWGLYAAKKLSLPERMSSTPVQPACTSNAEVIPLRAVMPPK